jgi:hypothetical protein
MKKGKKVITLFDIFFLAANILVVALFYKNIPLTFSLLLLIAVIGLTKWRSWRTVLIFIWAGIAGTVGEIFFISVGVWEYSITNFFNVPLWLFILWGNTAALIYQIAKKIKEKRMEIK